MRFNNSNYNRITAQQMFDWTDQWIIDKHGNLTLKDELSDSEIDTITIQPSSSAED